jgi:hypothetical protein
MKMKISPLMVATALVFATPAVADDIHETVATNPGAYHVLGRNVSATEPAKLLAVLVVDTADEELTTADR